MKDIPFYYEAYVLKIQTKRYLAGFQPFIIFMKKMGDHHLFEFFRLILTFHLLDQYLLTRH